MQPADIDPNRTGLIGPDWSETTTTIGEVQAKRTATNPDLAAAIARILLGLKPPPGAAVGDRGVGLVSRRQYRCDLGCRDVGLKPVIVSSLGSSMYRRERSGIRLARHGNRHPAARTSGAARTAAVVLGGESATAESLTGTGREMLIRAARRNGYEPIVAGDLAGLKRRVMEGDRPTRRPKDWLR